MKQLDHFSSITGVHRCAAEASWSASQDEGHVRTLPSSLTSALSAEREHLRLNPSCIWQHLHAKTYTLAQLQLSSKWVLTPRRGILHQSVTGSDDKLHGWKAMKSPLN